MGLSEHEKRVLDELEKSLYADDEGLAKRFKKAAAEAPAAKGQRTAQRKVAGALVAFAGLGVILIGVITHYIYAGLGGFVLTLAGLLLATSSAPKGETGSKSAAPGMPFGGGRGSAQAPTSKKADKTGKTGSLRDYFEDRWDKRTGL
jgi:hypothetical protein